MLYSEHSQLSEDSDSSEHSTPLDQMIWRQLGFEQQFGVTFFHNPVTSQDKTVDEEPEKNLPDPA